jgi:short-subunit dehydrogenase
VSTEFGEHVVAKRQGTVRPKSVRAVTAERVARAAYRGYRSRKREVVVPWTMIPMIKLYQLFPGLVEWGMGKAMPASPKDTTR